jgi:autotransporter-associated beta strand protein
MKPKVSLRFLLGCSSLALLAAPSLRAATYYWDDNAAGTGFGTAGANLGTWAAPTTGPTAGWSLSGTGANAFASFTTTTSDTVNFGNGATGLASGTITVSGTVNTGNMTFASGSGAITLSGSKISLGGGRIVTANNGGNIISSELALTGATTVRLAHVVNSGTTTLTLGKLSGTAGVTFESSADQNTLGTFILTEASTYTGDTILQTTSSTNTRAELQLGIANALPTTTVLNLQGTAGSGGGRTTSLNLAGFNQTLGGLSNSGGGSLRTFRVYSSTAATLTVNDSGDRTFSGLIGNGGTNIAVVKDGSGIWTLSGNNTFANGLTLKGTGAVTLAHASAAGTGAINLQSTQTSTPATLNLSGNINVANAIVIDSSTGRETIASNGNNTLSGNITINNAGTNSIVFINNNSLNAGTTFTVGGGTPNSTTITAANYTNVLSFRNSNNGNFGVLNSQINAPNASVNFNNNGSWTFNSTGNNWAVTSFSSGCDLVLGADDALATGAYLNFAGGAAGYLDLNGKNQTVAGLTGGNSAATNIKNDGGADSILTISGLTADRSYAGVIGDGATHKTSLVVNNANAFTQTLSGTNTYTGATTITAGTLALGATGTIDDSSGVILGGGTFDVSAKVGGYALDKLTGVGTVIGSLTVSTELAIGNSPGTVAFEDLTLGPGASFLYDVTGGGLTADLGNISGTLTLTGAILDLVQLGTYTLNDKFTLFAYDTGNLTGTFSSLADGAEFTDAGGLWKINYSDTTAGLNGGTGTSFVTITAIPEPRAALLGGIGVLLLFRRRRA